MMYPDLFKAVINLAVPVFPPAPEYIDLADQIAAGESLGLGYQLQFREEGVEKNIQGRDKLRHFLRAVSLAHPLANCRLLLIIFPVAGL
jgi:hypothetical protein